MKTHLLIFIIALIALTGCIGVVSQPMPSIAVPPGEPGGAPLATPPGEKLAVMVTQTLPPAAPATPEPSQTPTLPKTLADLGVPSATYQDQSAKLAFDYPSAWLITAPDEGTKQSAYIYSITLRSAEVTPGPKQQDGIPAGMAAIDISVNNRDPKTLAQAANERRQAATQSETGQPVKIISDEDITLPGGLPAHRFMNESGTTQTIEIVTVINGKMILMVGMGDLTLFDTVANSLREIK